MPDTPTPAAQHPIGARWWVGSYTADAGGHGEGIRLLSANPDGTLDDLGLAGHEDSPSFLAPHPELPVLYAVSEVRGTVSAYAVDEQHRLAPRGETWEAGPAACHVAVDPRGRFIVVACWGSGEVVLYRLDADGRIIDRHPAALPQDPYGATSPPDPYTGKARCPRAHATAFLRSGLIATTDLGYDLVRFWTYDMECGLVLDHEVTLPVGSGPRHLVEHPDGRLFVLTEYSLQVVMLSVPAATMPYAVSATAMLASPGPSTQAAEIALSPAGDRLYAGLRGSDQIATIAVSDTGIDLVALTPSGGHWPRHHALGDGVLYVAHERSDEVTVLDLDPATGVPGGVTQRLPVGSPTMLLRAR